MEEIEKVLDEMMVRYNIKENEALVEFWTDTAGQDIPVEFEYDGSAEDFVKKFSEYAENYNVDDEVELYADMRGKKGVPNTIRGIMDDCQEAKDTLMEISQKLKEALDGESNEDYFVTFKVEARYCVKVRAKSLEKAKKAAEAKFRTADFGKAEAIDGDIIIVTDKNRNYIFKK